MALKERARNGVGRRIYRSPSLCDMAPMTRPERFARGMLDSSPCPCSSARSQAPSGERTVTGFGIKRSEVVIHPDLPRALQRELAVGTKPITFRVPGFSTTGTMPTPRSFITRAARTTVSQAVQQREAIPPIRQIIGGMRAGNTAHASRSRVSLSPGYFSLGPCSRPSAITRVWTGAPRALFVRL